MTDRYQQLVNAPIGRKAADLLGLPRPAELRRYEPDAPVVDGPVLLGGAPDGDLVDPVRDVLEAVGADIHTVAADAATNGDGFAALVFDASGIGDAEQLEALHAFFHPGVRRLGRCGRVIVLRRRPADCDDADAAAAQRSLEGFTRSVAKEMRDGATAQLVSVADGAEEGLASTLRFLLSGRSAYVSGQVVPVGPPTEGRPTAPVDWDEPLAGQVAAVTGAARGIGASVAEVLSRGGAEVICIDLPVQGDQLSDVANRVGGSSLQLDVTAEHAPDRLAEHVAERHDGLDVMVHNAGITRDKTIAGMDVGRWRSVLSVNLASQQRLNRHLLDDDVLAEDGRIVSVASVAGIAGNRGQTNYATSKAGVIGTVEALADRMAERGGTINAVAPGFIETEMTMAMPVGPREVGRRINSLSQGGLPVDVAETIAWLASPASAWVNGTVVRVCGQSLLGA